MWSFSRLKHKAWFVGGAVLGLGIPIGIRMYERVLMLGHVRPIGLWVLWPTSLLMTLSRPYEVTTGAIFFLLTTLGNALLFGWLASVFRRASIGIAAVLVVVVWIALPPSDNALVKRFGEHSAELEQLVQMANSDTQFVQIGPNLAKTVDGREYRASEAQSVLLQARWAEYRRLFKAAGLNDGLYRSATTGDVFLSAHALGKIDPVGSSFGYLYCPVVAGRLSGFLPCMETQDSAERAGYRWKKLDSEWYIYEAYQRDSIE